MTDTFTLKDPTHTNPHIDKEWLAEIERAHRDRGEYDVFRREYLAEYVPGGARGIFPMFSRSRHVRPRHYIDQLINKDRNKLEWFALEDPASTSVFGVLFLGYNPYTKQIFVVDEIYERERNMTSTTKMWPRIQGIQIEHCRREDLWTHVYDNQAQWFANEVRDSFNFDGMIPTAKKLGGKPEQLSIMKDIFNYDMIMISEECEWFIHEIENYITKEDGSLYKKKDHLLDPYRYFIEYIAYNLPEEPEPIHRIDPAHYDRPVSVREDYQNWLMENKPDVAILDENYLSLEEWLY